MRYSTWVGLAILAGLVGLAVAAGHGDEPDGDEPRPSDVALAHGYPAGPYSNASFTVSDDAVEMVLSVTASRQEPPATRSLRMYGDGRLEIKAGNESYTRRLERQRMLEIFRSAVDHGLAEFDVDVLMAETQGATCPEGSERITVQFRLISYERAAEGVRAAIAEQASLCAPESFPQVAQSKALVDLAGLLEAEIAAARREGSIELPPEVPFKKAEIQLTADSGQLILRWRTGGGNVAGLGQRMELYGDGRLELSPRRGEAYTRQLSPADRVTLVRIAVDHGLAEWDDDKVRRSLSQGLAQRFSEGVYTVVELNLASYRRGRYHRAPLHRSFNFRNAGTTLKESPQVLELQGLDALSRFAAVQFQLAREGGGDA